MEAAGYVEKWITYGNPYFAAKELTVLPGRTVTIQDAGPYGFITVQGHGTIDKHPIETPALIRFGQLTCDEYFVGAKAAQAGVTIHNPSQSDPIVLLKHFGPHKDAPQRRCAVADAPSRNDEIHLGQVCLEQPGFFVYNNTRKTLLAGYSKGKVVMKVLVTGGAGYIGSIAVEQLILAGEEVVVFDNLYQGHRAAVHPQAAFVQGDLADRAAVDALMAAHQPDAIMHFASYTLVGESMQQPFLYLGDNVTNGLNLLRSAVEHGVKKFILSSTANLFDQPERMPIDEGERIVPGSPYGESKNILERILYWLDRTQGMRYACLRYFNAAGASPNGGKTTRPSPISSR